MCLHLSASEAATAFLGGFGLVAAVSAGVTTIVYRATERRGRARWWLVPDGHVSAGPAEGPFRGAREVPRYLPGAPARVRRVAFQSMTVGLWALALAPLALLMLPLAGVGLLLSPAIYAGWQLMNAGRALLRRDFSAALQARSASSWVRFVGWIFLCPLLVVALFSDAPLLPLLLAVPAVIALFTVSQLSRVVRDHAPELAFEQ